MWVADVPPGRCSFIALMIGGRYLGQLVSTIDLAVARKNLLD